MRGRVESKRQEKIDEIRAKVVNTDDAAFKAYLCEEKTKYITKTRPNTIAKI